AYGGVAQCYGESVPVLVVPGGYARRLMNVAPNYSAVREMRGVAKSAEPIIVAAEVPNVMRRAFSRLRNGRGRPGILRGPSDMWNEEVPEPLAYEPIRTTRYGPDPDAAREAAQLLAKAKRPVIYAGQGVHWARAWRELRALAELLGAPVTSSLGGKSAFPEDHPLALGSGGLAGAQPARHFLGTSARVFGIGCSFTETNFGVAMPKGTPIIHATLDPDHLNKDVPAAIGLVGDAGLTLEAVLAELKPLIPAARDASATAQEITRVREGWFD